MATQQLAKSPVGNLKVYLSEERVKVRFNEMLGKRGGAFTNSIINVVRNSSSLQKCSPESVISAAIVAATLNLPIDPALGQAAIVPYGKTAVFQIMYKGLTQLCIRSGQYATIHCSEIYADELKSHNPITGVVNFHDPSIYKMRYESKEGENVVGHYAYFRLISGFEKSDYMTHAEVMAHAKKYSKAYQKDLREKKKDSPWSINPIQMGNKTVLLRLEKKYGVMSIEMQDAIVQDNSFEAAESAAARKIDSEQGSEPIDANFESQPPSPELAKDPLPDSKRNKKSKKKVAKKKTEKIKFLYVCKNCGLQFNEPRVSGTEANPVNICPSTKCLSKNIVATEDEKPAFLED